MSTRLGFDVTGATDDRRQYHDRAPNARKIFTVEFPPGRTNFPSRNARTARSDFAKLRCREMFTQSIFVVVCLTFVGAVKGSRDENASEYSRRNQREYS